jgi:heme-degrading monooxygenase HmoA
MFIGKDRLSSIGVAIALSSMLLAPKMALAKLSLRGAVADGVPAPQTSGPQQILGPHAEHASTMQLVAVEWRIKKGQESEFLKYWSTRPAVADRSGVLANFLNQVDRNEQFPGIELHEDWTTFVNVTIWQSGSDFQQQIELLIDTSRPPLAFEAAPHRHVFMAPAQEGQ